MYPLISKRFYQIIQSIRCEDVFRCLKELEETQWYSYGELKALQWKKLKSLLEHAYKNVPYYRRKFEKIGMTPREILNPKDFERLPILTKQDIRENIADLIAINHNERIPDCTSGSTGTPLTFYKTHLATAYFLAAKYRGHHWYGIDIGDKEVKFWGVIRDFRKRQREGFKDFSLNRTLLSPFELSRDTVYRYYKECLRIRPKYMYGYVSAINRFAQFLEDEDIDGKALGLKAIITTSEVLYDFQRRNIEEIFGCKVVNEYGACEMGVAAFECPYGGMHITMENLYLEFIKEEKPVGTDESGEIVVTELNNYAMPFIRYNIGDIGKASNYICKCGRGLPLMEIVEGRTLDLVRLPDGRFLHAHLFNYIIRGSINRGNDIREFRIIQKKDMNIVIQLVLGECSSPMQGTDTASKNVVQYLRAEIQKFIGAEVGLTFEFPNSIPLDKSGKLRFFISELI